MAHKTQTTAALGLPSATETVVIAAVGFHSREENGNPQMINRDLNELWNQEGK
jgi:hypothetical protein